MILFLWHYIAYAVQMWNCSLSHSLTHSPLPLSEISQFDSQIEGSTDQLMGGVLSSCQDEWQQVVSISTLRHCYLPSQASTNNLQRQQHIMPYKPFSWLTGNNKKLSYRRKTARQLPTWRGLSPPVHSPSPLWLHLCVGSNPKSATNVRQACRP